jgi:hypothetical protein
MSGVWVLFWYSYIYSYRAWIISVQFRGSVFTGYVFQGCYSFRLNADWQKNITFNVWSMGPILIFLHIFISLMDPICAFSWPLLSGIPFSGLLLISPECRLVENCHSGIRTSSLGNFIQLRVWECTEAVTPIYLAVSPCSGFLPILSFILIQSYIRVSYQSFSFVEWLLWNVRWSWMRFGWLLLISRIQLRFSL